MHQFNATGNTQFVQDSVDLYVNQLTPLLKKIREATYANSRVEKEGNDYYLIQEKYTIQEVESALVIPEVLEFELGKINKGGKSSKNQTRKIVAPLFTLGALKTRKNRGGNKEDTAGESEEYGDDEEDEENDEDEE